MNTTEYLQTWSDSYKNDMISNIMPFWMKYGWDRKNGGFIPASTVMVS